MPDSLRDALPFLIDRCLPDVLFLLDGDGCITYVNAAGARILGYAPETMAARPLIDFVHSEDRALTRTALAGGKERTVREFENRCRCQDGAYRYFQWSVTEPAEPHESGTTCAFARDVTDYRRMEQQVKQNERLAALGELIAGVAHEINNPLAAIGGHAQLLQMIDDPQVKEDAAAITELVTRASRIVRSLRTYARPRGGVPRRRREDLNAAVTSALDIMAYRLRKGEVDLILELEPDLPYLWMSVGEVEQVIVNLLANAEYALRDRPVEQRTITVRTRIGEAGESAPEDSGPWCLLTVQDTGNGIPEGVLDRIFEPFFTTHGAEEGTGLGLHISQGIIAAHGGTIAVTSRDGEGATFAIRLPLRGQEVSESAIL